MIIIETLDLKLVCNLGNITATVFRNGVLVDLLYYEHEIVTWVKALLYPDSKHSRLLYSLCKVADQCNAVFCAFGSLARGKDPRRDLDITVIAEENEEEVAHRLRDLASFFGLEWDGMIVHPREALQIADKVMRVRLEAIDNIYMRNLGIAIIGLVCRDALGEALRALTWLGYTRIEPFLWIPSALKAGKLLRKHINELPHDSPLRCWVESSLRNKVCN